MYIISLMFSFRNLFYYNPEFEQNSDGRAKEIELTVQEYVTEGLKVY